MADRPLLARRLRWFEVALSVLAGAAFFVPWHVVHHTNALEGLFRPEPPPPVHDVGEPFRCSGFSHHQGEPWIPMLLGVMVVASVLASGRATAVCSAIKVAAAIGIAWLLSLRLLAHLFDRVEPRAGEYVFLLALALVVLAALGRMGAMLVARYRRRPVAAG